MANHDFLNKIRETEREASAITERAEEAARLNMEKARKEASVIVEQAYAEADQRRRYILKDAEKKSKVLLDSVNQKPDSEKLDVTRKKIDLAVDRVAERIVNTLGHR